MMAYWLSEVDADAYACHHRDAVRIVSNHPVSVRRANWLASRGDMLDLRSTGSLAHSYALRRPGRPRRSRRPPSLELKPMLARQQPRPDKPAQNCAG